MLTCCARIQGSLGRGPMPRGDRRGRKQRTGMRGKRTSTCSGGAPVRARGQWERGRQLRRQRWGRRPRRRGRRRQRWPDDEVSEHGAGDGGRGRRPSAASSHDKECGAWRREECGVRRLRQAFLSNENDGFGWHLLVGPVNFSAYQWAGLSAPKWKRAIPTNRWTLRCVFSVRWYEVSL
jgi:hypothetical protein